MSLGSYSSITKLNSSHYSNYFILPLPMAIKLKIDQKQKKLITLQRGSWQTESRNEKSEK